MQDLHFLRLIGCGKLQLPGLTAFDGQPLIFEAPSMLRQRVTTEVLMHEFVQRYVTQRMLIVEVPEGSEGAYIVETSVAPATTAELPANPMSSETPVAPAVTAEQALDPASPGPALEAVADALVEMSEIGQAGEVGEADANVTLTDAVSVTTEPPATEVADAPVAAEPSAPETVSEPEPTPDPVSLPEAPVEAAPVEAAPVEEAATTEAPPEAAEEAPSEDAPAEPTSKKKKNKR